MPPPSPISDQMIVDGPNHRPHGATTVTERQEELHPQRLWHFTSDWADVSKWGQAKFVMENGVIDDVYDVALTANGYVIAFMSGDFSLDIAQAFFDPRNGWTPGSEFDSITQYIDQDKCPGVQGPSTPITTILWVLDVIPFPPRRMVAQLWPCWASRSWE